MQFDYFLIFVIKCLAVTALTLAPGIWLWARFNLRLGYIPAPGVVGLAVAGALEWVLPACGGTLINWIVLLAFLAMVLDLCYLWAVADLPPSRGGPAMIAVFASVMVFLQAVAIGINPLPVAQEIGAGGPLPGRMIASPPDHGIPYSTASYLFHRFDGVEERQKYFGIWGLTARGPLVPLGINALFHLFRVDLDAPDSRATWPTSESGEDIARIYGWLMNASVVAGAFELMAALGVSSALTVTGIAWIALSPVVVVNTVYLWPKLAAAYFVMLAAAAIVERRNAMAGALMALAWLSHPVGALMLPAVGLFLLLMPASPDADQAGFKLLWHRSARFGVSLAIVMAPWLLYKLYLHQPDPFFNYVLGGGAGLKKAASLGVWMNTRFNNVFYTLMPGAFWTHGFMSQWIEGPLNDVLRWSIQYAKTLPGQLGLSCFLIAYCAMAVPQKDRILRAAKRSLLFANFAVMVVFWGFSEDGLGRNTLAPLSILIIVFTVAALPRSNRVILFLLPVLAAEGQWLQISGFVANPDFDLLQSPVLASGCLLASMLASFAIVAVAGRSCRTAGIGSAVTARAAA